ncbi:hypothetical protein Q73_05985 [Bacillus coahuilensis m2-6]|uniref:hypothetical protein n=1 Tax=Bacillus coahuilensis TaxID=408580 RepID=UPI0001850EA4|nr:hypothetical protein [Bacillus coahuilensis]KUP08460.1 hypothetical protein Q73_05985 [Bacillus coahuilensis m2-6]
MEILFLGETWIFGLLWIFVYYTTHIHNQMNVGTKGWTGQDEGGIKRFQFRLSPLILEITLFIILSFGITEIHYTEYFI